MFLHRWSILSQILHMSYCSSCRHYLLPSREISHVKGGDRFPYSILALKNGIRKVCSQQYSLTRTYLWASPFWKEHFNMTVKICIEQFTYIILFSSSVLNLHLCWSPTYYLWKPIALLMYIQLMTHITPLYNFKVLLWDCLHFEGQWLDIRRNYLEKNAYSLLICDFWQIFGVILAEFVLKCHSNTYKSQYPFHVINDISFQVINARMRKQTFKGKNTLVLWTYENILKWELRMD